MNILSTALVSAVMALSASLTPSDPVMAQFVEELRKECADSGVKVDYEMLDKTPAIIMSMPFEEPSTVFDMVPADALGQEVVKSMMGENGHAAGELFRSSGTKFVLRFVCSDGKTREIVVEPSQLP